MTPDELARCEAQDVQLRDLLVFGAAGDQYCLDLILGQVEPDVLQRFAQVKEAARPIAAFLLKRLDQLEQILAWDDEEAGGLFDAWAHQVIATDAAARWFFCEWLGVDWGLVLDTVAPGVADRLAVELSGFLPVEQLAPDQVDKLRDGIREHWEQVVRRPMPELEPPPAGALAHLQDLLGDLVEKPQQPHEGV